LASHSDRENSINDCVPIGTLVNDDKGKEFQLLLPPCRE